MSVKSEEEKEKGIHVHLPAGKPTATMTSYLVEVMEALGRSYRRALESRFLWRERDSYRGLTSSRYVFCADRIPLIFTRLLTGSNGGRLKGALFQHQEELWSLELQLKIQSKLVERDNQALLRCAMHACTTPGHKVYLQHSENHLSYSQWTQNTFSADLSPLIFIIFKFLEAYGQIKVLFYPNISIVF